jgi:hypothetical protein
MVNFMAASRNRCQTMAHVAGEPQSPLVAEVRRRRGDGQTTVHHHGAALLTAGRTLRGQKFRVTLKATVGGRA